MEKELTMQEELVKLRQENDIYINLLTELLSCGYADLSVIKDCQYDISELIDRVKDMGIEKIDLNNLAYAMFDAGKEEIQDFINERMEELKDQEELSDEEKEELETLEQLDPYEDIQSFHNYLDTNVYFHKNAESYKKYCPSVLATFEENTGYEINE
jgi:hypothetical protein